MCFGGSSSAVWFLLWLQSIQFIGNKNEKKRKKKKNLPHGVGEGFCQFLFFLFIFCCTAEKEKKMRLFKCCNWAFPSGLCVCNSPKWNEEFLKGWMMDFVSSPDHQGGPFQHFFFFFLLIAFFFFCYWGWRSLALLSCRVFFSCSFKAGGWAQIVHAAIRSLFACVGWKEKGVYGCTHWP